VPCIFCIYTNKGKLLLKEEKGSDITRSTGPYRSCTEDF